MHGIGWSVGATIEQDDSGDSDGILHDFSGYQLITGPAPGLLDTDDSLIEHLLHVGHTLYASVSQSASQPASQSASQPVSQ